MALKRGYNYIPRQDDDFFNFQGNLVNEVVANQMAWGIPSMAVNALVNRRASYEPLYTKSQDKGNRTQADVLAHRQMRNIYEKEIRVFGKAWLLFNPLVTDEDRRRMRLTVRDIEPSPSPVITDIPVVALRTQGGGEIEIRCRTTKDKTLPSMHTAANLIEFRFAMVEPGDIPPSDADDYPKKDVSSRAKFILKLGTKNTGKRFYGVFRWVNTRRPKQEGPWTEAISVVIA